MSRNLLTAVVILGLAAPIGAQTGDVATLEAKARELLAKKAYTKPPGENVVDVCKEIIMIDPTNATAAELLTKVAGILVGSGEGLLKKRNYRGALASFDEALALDGSNAKAKAGRDKARQALEREKFEVESGKPPEYYMTKGNELFEQGDYVRARKYYLAILKTLPDDPFAKLRERECSQKLGIEAPAAPTATPQDPASRLGYYREAAAQLEKASQWDAAMSYYRQILAAAPDDAEAKAGLERTEDRAMGYGRVTLAMVGDLFWWSAKVKTAGEAQAELGIRVKILVDGKESASFTDTVIETLTLGEVSRNDLKLPAGFSARVQSPGDNTIAVQISAGDDKPKVFAGQATIPVGRGQVLDLAIEGSSTLKFGGGFARKMGGTYTVVVRPAATAAATAQP